MQAQLRPSCEQILDLPAVKKMGEKIFKDSFYDDWEANAELLSTIRVPKNLLYLTDRLPKPMYTESPKSKSARAREIQELRRT